MPLLWKDFKHLEDCTECPVKNADYCSGGYVCYGNEPIEPPCCCFDDDTDLEKWVEERELEQLRYEEKEDRHIAIEAERAKKNAMAQQHRREAKWATRDETREIKSLKEKIKANEAAARFASNLAFAFNMTNEMFGYSERASYRENAMQEQNKPLLDRIAELETIKKEKLRQLKAERRVKEEAPNA